MLVALAALLVSMAGTAYAAVKVTGRDVVDASLSGADLRQNSLRGREIDERRLGTVRRARDATLLGGLGPGAFLAGTVVRQHTEVGEYGFESPYGLITATAACRRDEVAVSGSFAAPPPGSPVAVDVWRDGPTRDAYGNSLDSGETPGAWSVAGRMINQEGALTAYVVCATRGKKVR